MTDIRPTISAVIPAFNAEGCIARTVESILTQTRPAIEVIVVDDGSSDRTSDVVQSFGAPVRLVQQENAGPNAARNHGTRLAQGEWVAYLDADDAWLPGKLEKQARYLAEDGAAAVHSPTIGIDPEQDYEGELTFERLWKQNPVGMSTTVLRKAAWEHVGGFDEDRDLIGAEDYNLWLRLMIAGWRILRCPEQLVEYTPAENSLSSRTKMVVAAELLNAERVAEIAKLGSAKLRWKRNRIHAEYGQAFLHSREVRLARTHLGQAMLISPSPNTIKHWLATFVPESILDWRRGRNAVS